MRSSWSLIASLRWSPTYDGRSLYLSFDSGALYFSLRPHTAPTGFSLAASRATPRLLFNAFPTYGPRSSHPIWRGWISLAPVLGLLLLLVMSLWWCERRPVPPNHCRRCGYNLTGNETGRCPECGDPA